MEPESGGCESLSRYLYSYLTRCLLNRFFSYDADAKVLSCKVCKNWRKILTETDWEASFHKHLDKHFPPKALYPASQDPARLADDGEHNHQHSAPDSTGSQVSVNRSLDVSNGVGTGSSNRSEQSVDETSRSSQLNRGVAVSALAYGRGYWFTESVVAPAVGTADSSFVRTANGEMRSEELYDYGTRRSTFNDRASDTVQALAYGGFYVESNCSPNYEAYVLRCCECLGTILCDLKMLPSIAVRQEAHAEGCSKRNLDDGCLKSYPTFNSLRASQSD